MGQFEAAANDDLTTLQTLVDAEPSLIGCEFHYRSPLRFAVLNRGTHVNATDWLDVRQLYHGCLANDWDNWVGAGVLLDLVDSEYRSTPLGWAARSGKVDYVHQLLEAGADPQAAGADWATPLARAERRGHEKIAGILRKFGAKK